MIIDKYKETVKRNKAILDKFIAENQDIKSVKNRKLIYGIAINDSNYAVGGQSNYKKNKCSFYTTWVGMLKRCYSGAFQDRQPIYKGCTVCDEWHSFMAFKSWMEKQDWEGKQLDKDLLIIGNKTYSPKSCIFVSNAINSILTGSGSHKGKYPKGVCYHNQLNKYMARVNIDGTNKHIGCYATINEAETEYIKAKAANIIRIALKQDNPVLAEALIAQASNIRINFDSHQAYILDIKA